MLLSYCQTMVTGAMGPLRGLLPVSRVALRIRGMNLRQSVKVMQNLWRPATYQKMVQCTTTNCTPGHSNVRFLTLAVIRFSAYYLCFIDL